MTDADRDDEGDDVDWLPAVEGLFVALGSVLLVVYWLAILVVLINDQRDPTRTLAWLLFLYILPGFGLVVYYFAGRNWKKKVAKGEWVKEIVAVAGPTLERIRARYRAESEEAHLWTRERGYEDLVKLIETADGATPLPAYDVKIMPSGEEKFANLLEDMASATDTINIQYFIWERDELTAKITAVLMDRLSAGVEVRMLNDYIGNIQYKKDEINRLIGAGAKVKYDITEIGRANYRNHRKMVIIDSVLGYTGGINVGQEYIDGKPKYPHWRDTHVKFRGPAVAELQKLFASRWHEVTTENLFTERFFPLEYPIGSRRTLAQTVATGVEDKWESARRAHEVAMGEAAQRLWIQSPYFVPDDSIYEAMINAALAGLDVRLMMTGWPDKKIAWYAAESYFRPVLEAGGRIFWYEKGFFHAKTMTVDGKMLSIGTMNLDIRSLELHKELMVWFYDEELTLEHDAIFERDLRECKEVTLEHLDGLTGVQVFRDSAARLASNLL